MTDNSPEAILRRRTQDTLIILGTGLTLRGFHHLIYYFSMARYMVGGKQVLFRTVILLDLGIFTSTLSRSPSIYIILYIAGAQLFSGAVALLRANESRQTGSSRWKYTAAYGLMHIALFILVIAFGLFMHSTEFAVYVYAVGLIGTAFHRFIQAFRRTAIVYIQ